MDNKVRCIYCGGELEKAEISHMYESFGEKKILLQKIPGSKCKTCEIEVISLRTAQKTTDFLRDVEKGKIKGKIEEIIVVDFTA
jgi:YgiT-type zinc finger domain-containing protein